MVFLSYFSGIAGGNKGWTPSNGNMDHLLLGLWLCNAYTEYIMDSTTTQELLHEAIRIGREAQADPVGASNSLLTWIGISAIAILVGVILLQQHLIRGGRKEADETVKQYLSVSEQIRKDERESQSSLHQKLIDILERNHADIKLAQDEMLSSIQVSFNKIERDLADMKEDILHIEQKNSENEAKIAEHKKAIDALRRLINAKS